MPGRSGAFTSMRAMSSQVRNSRTTTRDEAPAAAQFALDAGALVVGQRHHAAERVQGGADVAVSSTISSARQFSLLPATTVPKRSRMRPRGGAISRALIRLLSARVA